VRQIEQYKKIAAENERMARMACDEALRKMYSKFARQWHEAARQAEMAAPASGHFKSAPSPRNHRRETTDFGPS
jgi:hypothetical protein